MAEITLTLEDMIGEVRSELAEQVSGFLEDAEITRALNQGQLQFAYKTGICTTSSSSLSVLDQKKYGLPGDFLRIQKVFYDGKRIRPLNDHELINLANRSRLDNGGTPRRYYLRGTASSGLCLFLFEVPQTTGDTIEIWYEQSPEALENGADVTIIPRQFHRAPVVFALRRFRLKRGERAFAADLFAEWEDFIAEATSWSDRPHTDEPQTVADRAQWTYEGYGEDAAIGEVP